MAGMQLQELAMAVLDDDGIMPHAAMADIFSRADRLRAA